MALQKAFILIYEQMNESFDLNLYFREEDTYQAFSFDRVLISFTN